MRQVTGRELFHRAEAEVPCVMLGSPYGGHWVAPAGLETGGVVYSAGVGEDISFDLDVIRRFGVTVHAFDPTPRSVRWVAQQEVPPGFHMHALGLAGRDGVARFRPPDDPDHISHTILDRPSTEDRGFDVEVRTLATLMGELGHPRLDILKMDIEGAEYEVLDDICGARLEIDQILIEFHHQLPGVGLDRTRRAVRQLGEAGYRVFHISDTGREYSFAHTRTLESV